MILLPVIIVGGFQAVDAGLRAAVPPRLPAAPEEDKDALLSTATTIGTDDTTTKLIYIASIFVIGMLVIGLYWKRPAAVIVRIMMYLLSLSTIKMSVRSLFEVYNFDFPKLLTTLHFLTSGLFCCAVLMCTSSPSAAKRGAMPSWGCMCGMILPISMAFACSIAAGNAALVHSSTSFVEMISSSTPACTVVVAIVFQQPFRKQLVWPVLVVCGGLALCASGAMHFSMMGFLFSLCATLLRSVKSVLQQILMVGQDARFEPLELLAWISVPSVTVMLAWSLATEGTLPYSMLAGPGSLNLIICIGLTCVNASILNVMGIFVVKDLGAVGAQLAGQLKGVLTVLGGMAVLHERVYPQQAVGYGFVLLGVFWYTNMESSLKAQEKQKADQTSQESCPLLSHQLGGRASHQSTS